MKLPTIEEAIAKLVDSAMLQAGRAAPCLRKESARMEQALGMR